MTNQLQPGGWTFLSNHSHVLICISNWPDLRIRDIAVKVRITERAVQRILVDLERAGYLKRERVGRQNRYRLEPGVHLRHPLSDHVEVGRLLAILQPGIVASEIPVRILRGSTVVTARGLKTVPSHADAKAISRLNEKPRKIRKLIAKRPV